jgi:hypothetical protein
MANAKRRRTQRTDDDDFNIPIADALAQLLPARHITTGASWYFRVEGDQLVITRSVPTVTIPDPES